MSNGTNLDGRFLQVSGFRLRYDLSRCPMERLVSAELAGEDGYSRLEDDKEYDVVVTDYLARTDFYEINKYGGDQRQQGPMDVDILKDYFKVKVAAYYARVLTNEPALDVKEKV